MGGGGSLLALSPLLPWALLFVVVGPPLSALALLAAGQLARDKGGVHRRALILGLAWLLGGLVIITAIPKKYPRLAAPLSPAVALLVGAALARKPRLEWLLAGALLPAGWLLAQSTADLPIPAPPGGGVDGRCPQLWLRPPHAGDLGLGAAARLLQDAPPGPILALDMPDIPCSVQTTHPWPQHLGPYLRRSGAERELRAAPPAALVLRWVEGPMPEGRDGVPIPELDGWLRLERP